MTALSSEFEAAWAAFQSVAQLRLKEDTIESEWTRGRSEYLAFLVPVEDSTVRDYAAQAIEVISDIAGVEPFPQVYWHMTVKGLGFLVSQPMAPDELSDRDLQRLSAAARSVFTEAETFEARAGRPNAFPEVVILEVWDSLPVRDLNCLLLERIPG